MRIFLLGLLLPYCLTYAQNRTPKEVTFEHQDTYFFKEISSSTVHTKNLRRMTESETHQFMNQNACLNKIKKSIKDTLHAHPKLRNDSFEVSFTFPNNASMANYEYGRRLVLSDQKSRFYVAGADRMKYRLQGISLVIEGLKIKDGEESFTADLALNTSSWNVAGEIYEDDEPLAITAAQGDIVGVNRRAGDYICDIEIGRYINELIESAIKSKKAMRNEEDHKPINDDPRWPEGNRRDRGQQDRPGGSSRKE